MGGLDALSPPLPLPLKGAAAGGHLPIGAPSPHGPHALCPPRLLPLQLPEAELPCRPGRLQPCLLPIPATPSGGEAQGCRLRVGVESRSQ